MTGELRVTVQSWMLNKYDFDAMKADFESKHEGVTVVYNQVEDADVTTNMLQWSQGKTDCDITIGGGREHAVQYAARGYLTEFGDDFFTGDFARDKFYDVFLELGNVEGHQYMIPFCCEVVAISVNKTIFEEAGLLNADGSVPQPKDWAELRSYAEKIQALGKNYTGLSIDWGTNMMTYSYLSSLQGVRGSIYESDGKTIDFSSTEATDLLQTWQDLVKDKLSPIDTFADMNAGRTNFKAGTVGMLVAAHSRWIECEEQLGDGNVGIMLLPGTDTNGTIAYIHGAMISSLSTKQTLAKAFIKEELLSDTIMTAALDTYGKMSPMAAHYENLENPDWTVVLAATKNAIATPLYKDFNKLDQNIITELQNCISGSQDPATTLSNLAAFIKTLDLSTGLSETK